MQQVSNDALVPPRQELSPRNISLQPFLCGGHFLGCLLKQ
jgi:hypothetical protein